MKAIVVRAHGGPERLEAAVVDEPVPGRGEARVRVEFAGVNFLDVYHRTGLYALDTPFIPGNEGAGVVDALGEDVSDVAVGDRVAWAMHRGAYAERAVVPAWKLVRLPDALPAETAAAVMLQGMTAHYLARSTFRLEPGHTCVVHAAAGGVGLLLVQIAARAGARVIGTVSNEGKAELARAAGAAHVVLYTRQDFLEAARRLTNGAGVDVVYDSVGADTWERSLHALRPRGMLVLFGQSSGTVPPLDPAILAARGSLFLTRPTLAHYAQTRDEVRERTDDLFGWLAAGQLRVRIDRVLPLDQASEAHRLLESRRTTGKLLLRVS